jgi:hypothetical protein
MKKVHEFTIDIRLYQDFKITCLKRPVASPGKHKPKPKLLLFNVLYKDIERYLYNIVWVPCFSIDSQPETVFALFLKTAIK